MTTITFNIEWDPDAEVYWASSDDVDGLVIEGKTVDEVQRDILALLPDFGDQIKTKFRRPGKMMTVKKRSLSVKMNTHRQDKMLISA